MFKIHILNVGHGDCIVVEFPPPSNRLSVIDINRSTEMDFQSFDEVLSEFSKRNSSLVKALYRAGVKTHDQSLSEIGYNVKLTDPLSYIKKLAGGRKIFRFISTHPHMDHLSGLKALFEEVGIINVWVMSNDFKPDLGKLNNAEKKDWYLYTLFRNNSVDGVTIVRPIEGDQKDFWQQDRIHILTPNLEIISNSSDPNGISYVLVIKYGKHKIVLGGDAEQCTWDCLVGNYPDMLKDITILKASHHGRDTGYHQQAVKLMNPDCTVVSVGKKPENDASQKYNQYSNKVLSTRWYGTIRFELNEDGSGKYFTEYQRD